MSTPVVGTPRSSWDSGWRFFCDIKVAHSVFALPFAAASLLLPGVGLPTLGQAGWLLLAMISARSFAMGYNRIHDRVCDAANPRTRQRWLARQPDKVAAAWGWTLSCATVLVVAASALDLRCGGAAPLLLTLLAGYSHLKHHSFLCHLFLGLCLALSPLAVTLALGAPWSPAVLLLAGGILTWVASFDVIYALADLEFDRSAGLHSVPARFGRAAACRAVALGYALTLTLWGSLAYWVPFAAGPFVLALVAIGGIFGLQLAALASWTPPGANSFQRLFQLNLAVGPIFFVALVLELYGPG